MHSFLFVYFYNDSFVVEKLITVAKKVLEEKGCDLNDIRLGFHCPPFNSVGHLHLHVIAPASGLSFLSGAIFRPNTWWFTAVMYFISCCYQ